MDTFLGRNAKTCRTKVRRARRRGEQKERTGERGARVTESIVEAYWESANSPGFNLTGEPWTPFNIQARARASARRLAAPCELLQRNRHVKHLEARYAILAHPGRTKKGNETFGIFDISGVIVESFQFARYPAAASMDFEFFLPAFLPSFPSFILCRFFLHANLL